MGEEHDCNGALNGDASTTRSGSSESSLDSSSSDSEAAGENGVAHQVAQTQQYAAAAINQAATSSANGIVGRRVIPTQYDGTVRLVPALFQHCELSDLLALTAAMLDRLIEHNDTLTETRPLTRFHSKAAPAITPLAYLTRITTFINVDPCILIILLFYIDKLGGFFSINSLTVHRFLIAAVCCGSKALSDSFATNSRYAKVGGVELVEMNMLEREFLAAIEWRLATSGAMLDQYWRSLVQTHSGYGLLEVSDVRPAKKQKIVKEM